MLQHRHYLAHPVGKDLAHGRGIVGAEAADAHRRCPAGDEYAR